MQQFDIDNQNFNLQLELQYLRARNRQRRRRVLIMGLAVFSLIYVLLQPNQYEKNNTQIPYSQTNTTEQNVTSEVNQTLVLIQKHFALLEKLLISQFEGSWYDQQINGLSQASFFKNSYQTHMQIQFQLKLIQGQFLEDDYYYFSFYLTSAQLQLSQEDDLFYFENVKTSYRYSNVFQNDQYSQEATANITMKLKNININDKNDKNLDDIEMNLNITYCLKDNIEQNQISKTEFYSELNYKNIDNKAIVYSSIVSLLNVIQFISCLKLMKDFINESRQANQFSLFIFVFLMIFDGYLGIVHFFLALQSEYYLTPAFLELVLFFFLELKLAMHIWKERFMSLQDNLNIRRELYKFYIKFYLFAMVLVLLLYYFVYYNLFLVLINLYLIPQIIHIAYKGQYVDFDKMFVFGLLATRLFIPLYFRGCPFNVLHAQVSYFTCFLIIFLFFAQAILYYFQCTIGPRFFLPRWMRPKTHDYFIDQAIEGECAICITTLTDQPTEAALDNKYIARIISINSNKLMETPCGHHFHAICLTKWMNVKLNCPTCRSVLPPLI